MPDPLTNLEIQDVLSSIRRLVSEDNRHRAERERARGADAVGAAEPGKLVLTESLRVVPEAAPAPDAPGPDAIAPDASEAEAAEAPAAPVAVTPEPVSAGELSLDEAVTGDARFEAEDVLPAVAEAEAAGGDTWEPAEEAGAGGSLEGTIAELEAAVAGIGGEFEPDGSEVVRAQGLDAELEEAFEESFAVDLAAEDEAEELAALAQPVTAGAAMATRVPAPPEDAGDGAAGDGPEEEPMVEAAGLDDAAASADETDAEPAGVAVDPAEVPVHRPATSVDHFDLGGAEDATAALVIPAFVHSGPARPGAVAEAMAEAPRPAGPRRLTLTAAEAVPPDTAARGHGDAPAADWEAESGPGDAPGLASALAGEPAEAAASGGDEDERSIFGPGEEGVIDMAMLRDLVAEIIREELQGPLGERITRNVRMLVRREINRALEARGLD